MKYFFLFALFILNAFPVFSQKEVLSVLDYASTMEKQTIMAQPMDTTVKLEYFLFLTKRCNPEYTADVKKWFSDIILELKKKKIEKKSNKQKIAMIQKMVNKKCLLKYSYYAEFHEIYEAGVFNCVTGSVLFALIFDEFHIPYEVLYSPIHVYLMAYPSTEKFVVEATAKSDEVMVYSKTFKEEYIQMLADRKTISVAQRAKYSVDELFSKHYLNETRINLWKLIGVHYLNYGIQLSSSDDYLKIFSAAYKASLFNQDEKTEYLLMNYLERIDDKIPTSAYSAILLSVRKQYSYNPLIGEIAHHYYYNRLYHMYEEGKADSLIQKTVLEAKEVIADSALLNDVLFNERLWAFDYADEWEIEERFDIAKQAFKFNPEHTKLKKQLGLLFFSQISNYESPEDMQTALNEFVNEFPQMKDNESIKMASILAELAIVDELYGKRKIKEANSRFLELEPKLHEIKIEETLLEFAVANVYGDFVSWNVREGNLKLAAAILDKGIELLPDSYDFRTRRKSLRDKGF
ncbi:MAG: hypothetical protein ACKOXB_15030 [Flavobacteriales bacterium]